MRDQHTIYCGLCYGHGYVAGVQCPQCDGIGKIVIPAYKEVTTNWVRIFSIAFWIVFLGAVGYVIRGCY